MPLDANAIDEIRIGFAKIAAGRDTVPLTRENFVATARVMSEAIKSVTESVIDRLDTGQFVVVN
jgi:hypothetical protein